jgi:PPOX class probable F420-dependent enzyme
MSVLPGPDSEFGGRVRRRLEDEQVIWLTTLTSAGAPQPNPVWFVFEPDTESLLIYNDNNARRLAHVATHPRAAAHFNTDAAGDDVVVFTGALERAYDAPGPNRNEAYVAKYATAIERIGMDSAQFAQKYSVPLRLRIARVRGF